MLCDLIATVLLMSFVHFVHYIHFYGWLIDSLSPGKQFFSHVGTDTLLWKITNGISSLSSNFLHT